MVLKGSKDTQLVLFFSTPFRRFYYFPLQERADSKQAQDIESLAIYWKVSSVCPKGATSSVSEDWVLLALSSELGNHLLSGYLLCVNQRLPGQNQAFGAQASVTFTRDGMSQSPR